MRGGPLHPRITRSDDPGASLRVAGLGPTALAVPAVPGEDRRMQSDVIELLGRAASATEAVLGQLGPSCSGNPTPCPEMTVNQVAAHLIGGIRGLRAVAEGEALSWDAELDPDLGGRSTAAVFRADVDALLRSYAVPGRLDTDFAMPWGPASGAQLMGFELIEVVVHGLDVAKGLGVDLPVDDDVVTATLAGARMWVDDSVRVPGMFGAEVAVSDAGPLDELVAFLGRDPRWPDRR